MSTPWPNAAVASGQTGTTLEERKPLSQSEYAKICLSEAQALMAFAIFITLNIFFPFSFQIEQIVNFNEAQPARGYINIITTVLGALPIIVLALYCLSWIVILNPKNQERLQRLSAQERKMRLPAVIFLISIVFFIISLNIFGVGWLVHHDILPREIRSVTSAATYLTLSVTAVVAAFLRVQKALSLLNAASE